VGLFAIGKRKGLFSGEEIVKRQTTLSTTNLKSAGSFYPFPFYSPYHLIWRGFGLTVIASSEIRVTLLL